MTGFFLVCFLSAALMSYLLSFYLNKSLLGVDKGGLATLGAVWLGWTAMSFFPDSSLGYSVLSFYPFLIAATGITVYSLAHPHKNSFWIYFAICMFCMPFFSADLLVFQGVLPLFWDRTIAAVLWAAFIKMYEDISEVEEMTSIQTMALCFGFASLPILFSAAFPSFFIYYPLTIIAALFGFLICKRKSYWYTLGKTGAVSFGFLMGLFFFLVAARGFWLAALVMPAYYYAEYIYAALNAVKRRMRGEQSDCSLFFIGQLDARGYKRPGIKTFLFRRMLVISFFGALVSAMTVSIYSQALLIFMVLLIIFIDTYLRMRDWDNPTRFRDLFKDMKSAYTAVKSSVKEDVREVKNRHK